MFQVLYQTSSTHLATDFRNIQWSVGMDAQRDGMSKMMWRGSQRSEELLLLEDVSLRRLSIERKAGIFPMKKV